MIRRIAKSPYVLISVTAALLVASGCGDDEGDPGDGGKTGGRGGSANGGSSGASSGNGGAGEAGSSTGGTGRGGRGGSSTGGSSTGGSSTGGDAGDGQGGSSGNAGDAGNGTGGTNGGTGGTDGGMGGGGGEGGDIIEADTLDNPGFEEGLVGTLVPGWEESGDVDASYIEWTGGRNGSHKLGHWRAWSEKMQTFSVRTFQTVEPIPNGTYTFSMWVTGHLDFMDQYLFARGHDANDPELEIKQDTTARSDSMYVQITLENIEVTSGQVTVGIHSAGWGDRWANIDDAELTLQE